jgi:predicted transcriptional regulator of viral defense system
MKKQSHLVHQLLTQKTLLRPNDAVSSGYSRMYLAQLTKRGELRKIGRGLYASPLRKETEESGLAEIATKHPRSVVCLLSALSLHVLKNGEFLPKILPVGAGNTKDRWINLDDTTRKNISNE